VSRPITSIVIHCSAETHGARTRAADIDRWHRQRGFRKIGYHYVIGSDGRVETGRPEAEPGAHVAGHNRDTIGICLVGGLAPRTGVPSGTFAPVQFTALSRLIRDLLTRYPTARVRGHRDFPGVAKDCPCFDAAAWWAQEAART
jgi:N-acetylmuramoyl-L-alanine amidase